jgi:hypothetical protein
MPSIALNKAVLDNHEFAATLYVASKFAKLGPSLPVCVPLVKVKVNCDDAGNIGLILNVGCGFIDI